MSRRLHALVLHGVFILSGISALIYQLVWQRALLTIYGSNVESVAMVVAAFLAGLGIGSIAGGWISKSARAPLAQIAEQLITADKKLSDAYDVIERAAEKRDVLQAEVAKLGRRMADAMADAGVDGVRLHGKNITRCLEEHATVDISDDEYTDLSN